MDFTKLKLNRRNALKAAALGLTSASLAACSDEKLPVSASIGKIGDDGKRVLPWSNWSGNQFCQPSVRAVPHDEDELKTLVTNAKSNVRFVGSGHSFTGLVPTDDTLISLAAMRGVESLNTKTGEVDIWAGTRLAQIGEPLWQQGRALINMPDIDTQALAGAIATSTHGTGASLGSMSSQVSQLRLMDAQGQWIDCSEDSNSEIFHASRTHLGALGAVSKIRLQTRDAYYLEERTWMMSLEEGLNKAEQLRDEHRHFEMYALPHGDYILGISINETDNAVESPAQSDSDSEDTFRTIAAILDFVPFLRSTVINASASRIEEQTRSDRSYKIFGNLRNMRFNEMEYSIPWEFGPQCLKEILDTIRRENIDVIFPIEYRYVKNDDIWLSPFYQQDSCAISCHNFHDRDYKNYFAAIEPIFWKYGGRPHPGKIHTLTAKQLSGLYPKWDAFLQVRKQLDPHGKFLNQHLKTVLGVS